MVWRYGAFVMLIEFAFNFVALERLYYIPDSFIENFNTNVFCIKSDELYLQPIFIHSFKQRRFGRSVLLLELDDFFFGGGVVFLFVGGWLFVVS